MSNKELPISYKIGACFGELISGFFKLLYMGTFKICKRYKVLIIVYIVLALVLFLSTTNHDFMVVMAWILLLTAFSFGILEFIKEYPIKKKRVYFKGIFEEIGLIHPDGSTPFFLGEKNISNYALKIMFYNKLPLSLWNSKKDVLEMHMNQKIIDCKCGTNDKQLLTLTIETNPLPTRLDWDDIFLFSERCILSIGVDYFDKIGLDLRQHAHAFVAGETGSGKSNILKCLIYQAIKKEYDVIVIDFKRGVSFSAFANKVKIYYEYSTILDMLKKMVQETCQRLDLFRQTSVDNIEAYNAVSNHYLNRKIIFIDELAELLKTRDKEISNILMDSIETLTRLSRATGIHLIMGIQRPDSTIISGQIKNNVSYRVCGRFVDPEPSRIMLGCDLASKLPNIKGRFIVKDDSLHTVQAFYYNDTDTVIEKNEIENLENDVSQNNILTIPSKEFSFDFSDIRDIKE